MKACKIGKVVACVVAVCSLVITVYGAIGIFLLADAGLYRQSWDTWEESLYERTAASLATAITESYAARTHSGFSAEELAALGWGNDWKTLGCWAGVTENWSYSIAAGGSVKETTYEKDSVGAVPHSYTLSVEYPCQTSNSAILRNSTRYYRSDGTSAVLYYHFVRSQSYDVTIWLQSDSVENYQNIHPNIYQFLYGFRYLLIGATVTGLLLLILALTYLLWSAGRDNREIHPASLNRLPLDLFGLCACFGVIISGGFSLDCIESALYYSANIDWGWAAISVFFGSLSALCAVVFLWLFAAQWKLGWRFMWQHSLLGKGFLLLAKAFRVGWKLICRLYKLLPLIWKYLLIAASMTIVPLLLYGLCSRISLTEGRVFFALLFMLSLLGDVAIVAYGAYAYGYLLNEAAKMAEGELQTKLNTRYLYGSYRDCAENLNTLAEVSLVAARKQLRSERMKTELITNVSHDIKTPLTSVINYIDLLQNSDDTEQSKGYLEVLARQSHRLKKLVEDLIDMSRATTGDMAVDIQQIDLTEALRQALGEFSDKLDAQNLTVVLRESPESIAVQADGSLTWRILSNLLTNVVKYALPGTRVYVDLIPGEAMTCLSIKNISKEPLNISADELTERFVRGDTSRNTEGSGLGLNIAQSLMQLQKGKLELLVDGDLFKVTLYFQN